MRKVCQFCALLAGMAVLAFVTVPAIAQGVQAQLADKLAGLKQSLAQNQQNLHHYQWTETTQLTLKGEPKPPKQSLCQYGPDGQVQKTPIAQEGMQPSQGGRLKQRMVKKKTEEMQDYTADVKQLLSVYVPPDPVKLQQAYQAGNASIAKGPAPGTVKLDLPKLRQTRRSVDHHLQQSAKEDFAAQRARPICSSPAMQSPWTLTSPVSPTAPTTRRRLCST